jgi:uncharacterized phage protein (TIGR01671 family)
MEILKFKAWVESEKKMLPVWQMWFPQAGASPRAMVKSPKTGKFVIGPFPIMQCTGLKDRFGKEIYEGDVIECHEGANTMDQREYDVVVVVRFGRSGYGSVVDVHGEHCGGMYFSLPYEGCMKILGNIYENPELAEKAGGL